MTQQDDQARPDEAERDEWGIRPETSREVVESILKDGTDPKIKAWALTVLELLSQLDAAKKRASIAQDLIEELKLVIVDRAAENQQIKARCERLEAANRSFGDAYLAQAHPLSGDET